MDSVRRRTAAWRCNAAIAGLEVIGTYLTFRGQGRSSWMFYTIDSNLLALAASAAYVATGRRRTPPRWVGTARYMATIGLTLTFIVVAAVLAPQMGVQAMLLQGAMPIHHVLCPLLSLISYVRLEDGPRPMLAIGLVPTLAYAAVIVALNIARVIVGPYPFLHVYQQPVYVSLLWLAGIVGSAAAIGWLLIRLRDAAQH